MIKTFFYFTNTNKNEETQAQNKIEKKLKKIESLTKQLNFPSDLKIKVTKQNNSQFEISYSLKLPKQNISIKKSGPSITQAIDISFKVLKFQTLKYLDQLKDKDKVNFEYQYDIPTEEIDKTIKDQNKQLFGELIIQHSQKVKNYINRQVEYELKSKQLNSDILSVDDLFSEVVEKAFKQYKQRPTHITLYWWMYTLADKIISDKIFIKTAQTKNDQSYESLLKKEIDDLNFNFIVNAGGELQTKETTPYQESTQYKINEILKVPDRLKQLEDSELLRKVVSIISYLPELDRSIFDLYIMDGLTEDKIATIKSIKKQQVHDTINKVIKLIKQKLE